MLVNVIVKEKILPIRASIDVKKNQGRGKQSKFERLLHSSSSSTSSEDPEQGEEESIEP